MISLCSWTTDQGDWIDTESCVPKASSRISSTSTSTYAAPPSPPAFPEGLTSNMALPMALSLHESQQNSLPTCSWYGAPVAPSPANADANAAWCYVFLAGDGRTIEREDEQRGKGVTNGARNDASKSSKVAGKGVAKGANNRNKQGEEQSLKTYNDVGIWQPPSGQQLGNRQRQQRQQGNAAMASFAAPGSWTYGGKKSSSCAE